MKLTLGWRWKQEPTKKDRRREARRNPPKPTGLPRDGFCDQCGDRVDYGDHTRCERRRELEPPRFCADCARRMVVQVTPTGWTATCSRHGERSSDADPPAGETGGPTASDEGS